MLTSCPRCQLTFRSPCCGGGRAVGELACCTTTTTQCCLVPSSPDPSPSLPIAFILPPPPINPKPNSLYLLNGQNHQSDMDLQSVENTLRRLKTSGWYYEGITRQESIALLAPTKPGTFLVRESSSPNYLFSLSVHTEGGVTSVRIHYVNGYYRLDANPALLPTMPLFDCVVKLVEYYVYTFHKEQVFIDLTDHKYCNILLKTPLYQKGRPPSLQHLARLKVNALLKNGDSVPKLNIPPTLKKYLQDYPHTL